MVGRRQRMSVRRSPIRVVSYKQDIRVGLKKKKIIIFFIKHLLVIQKGVVGRRQRMSVRAETCKTFFHHR